MRVTIYTDGGADPNPGVGGWAAILRAAGHEKILSGNEKWTTNNRMELTAAVSALRALKKPTEVEFYTDSKYLSKGITEWMERWNKAGWKRKGKPIPNDDLWKELWALSSQHDIAWHWVRGHSGDKLNERVDRLARAAREEIAPTVTIDPKSPRLFVRASCKGNPGPGGWGAVLENEGETEQLSGSEPETTNNRMELVAVLEGLKLLYEGSQVIVVTTSDYVFTGATKWIKGWRQRNWTRRDGKPISNMDLWKAIDQLMSSYRIKWVSAKSRRDDGFQALEEASRLALQAVEMEL